LFSLAPVDANPNLSNNHVIAKVQDMAERDLTIDDFDCAKHVPFFKKCAKSLPAPW